MHRDLKPLNIILDENYNIKLIDFGESKYIGQNLDENNPNDTFVGTPYYQSPEVIGRDNHGFGLDTWSMGVLIFKMLTGNLPFPGTNKNLVYADILDLKIRWPDKKAMKLYMSPQAKDLIEKMITTDPSTRLGNNPSSIKDLKQHPFFRNIDFNNISDKDYKGAYDLIIPLLNGDAPEAEDQVKL